jgi:hypothetical protein
LVIGDHWSLAIIGHGAVIVYRAIIVYRAWAIGCAFSGK